ncbi:hypothetical protein PR048_016362 [Dryococelus australis]|uniref:Uncharacterized protein n=1 Tax=Dryococelus australis TaxID=614101 RepID=A0ABQ9HJI6_9NEOP|nr:hypothetical protein PR048_016362 [Dryococelus australis]
MYTKEPGIVKTYFNEDERLKRLSYRQHVHSSPKLDADWLYQGCVPISRDKKDLMSMIHRIDPDCRNFYHHLQESSSVRDLHPDEDRTGAVMELNVPSLL